MKKKILSCIMSAFMLATGAVGVMAAEPIEQPSVQTKVITHHLSNVSVYGHTNWNHTFSVPNGHNNLRAFYSNLTSSSARGTVTRTGFIGNTIQVMSFTVNANSNGHNTITNASAANHIIEMMSVGGSENLNGILSVASSNDPFPPIMEVDADF